ncbi:MAG TPA: sialidase family protein, partial [Bryobacteraceae bacterium]|nr:sialidase family protein [Bryobacteraceae bacterium]
MPGSYSRRTLLFGTAAWGLEAAAPPRREVFFASPAEGIAVMGFAFYVAPRGGDMLSMEERWSRSDTVDAAYIRRSQDHGRTWTAPLERRIREARPGGMLRRHPHGGYFDAKGRYVDFWTEGVLAGDDPLEGLRQWNIYFRISRDSGRTFGPVSQIIHTGSEYDGTHPLPGVWTGKNCVMLGERTCIPISSREGNILLPVQITPLGPDDKLYNPRGAYTYTEAAVLHGRWQGGGLQWEMSDLIRGDPARSTRGMDEPTIAFLQDGRLLMVLRGSNDRQPELPSYRWFSVSSDGGRRWAAPQPWTYQDGEPFFSPSACSQLVRHSSGRLFWLGNITPANPRGNRPRYPFVIGEVDGLTGLLLRRSVRVIDTLRPGEDPILSLSNFYAREDRIS